MDMQPGFIQIAKQLFPKAIITVDSFHIIKPVIDAFRKMLKDFKSILRNKKIRDLDFLKKPIITCYKMRLP